MDTNSNSPVPAIPVDRPTLFREIDALGGTGFPDEGESWSRGYSEALSDVLAILEKRGFTEAADAARAVQLADQINAALTTPADKSDGLS